MAKGFIKAQNGTEIEIVDAQSRTDIASIKSQIAKFTAPTGELEITENGTFDVTALASVLVNVAVASGGSGETESEGNISTNANIDCFLFTQETAYPTSESGWQFEIPHHLGIVPDWAFILITTYICNTSYVGGWMGYDGFNAVLTNARSMTGKCEEVSMQDSAAQYLFADAEKFVCKTPGWGGSVPAEAEFIVVCGVHTGGE